MRNLIVSEHISLDGYIAGTSGEMDWIRFDEEMFDLVKEFTDAADAALYGRVTWQMMDNYWPSAADKPDAGKHDIEHSIWYNKVEKYVLSGTLKIVAAPKVTIIGDHIKSKIEAIKKQPGKNILTFGSPSAVHLMMQYNLIDEYWLFINPVVLGQGIPFFPGLKKKTELSFVAARYFKCGVVGINYRVIRMDE